MSCQVEIPEVGGCLKDFIEALPPGTLDRVVETMDAALARAPDATFAKVDGAIRGLERKVAALLMEQNAVTDELAHVQGIIDEAEQFLRKIDCPELRVLKEMWDDQKREVAERLAAIDTGPVEDALRKHRELKTSLACQPLTRRSRVACEQVLREVGDESIDRLASSAPAFQRSLPSPGPFDSVVFMEPDETNRASPGGRAHFSSLMVVESSAQVGGGAVVPLTVVALKNVREGSHEVTQGPKDRRVKGQQANAPACAALSRSAAGRRKVTDFVRSFPPAPQSGAARQAGRGT